MQSSFFCLIVSFCFSLPLPQMVQCVSSRRRSSGASWSLWGTQISRLACFLSSFSLFLSFEEKQAVPDFSVSVSLCLCVSLSFRNHRSASSHGCAKRSRFASFLLLLWLPVATVFVMAHLIFAFLKQPNKQQRKRKRKSWSIWMRRCCPPNASCRRTPRPAAVSIARPLCDEWRVRRSSQQRDSRSTSRRTQAPPAAGTTPATAAPAAAAATCLV